MLELIYDRAEHRRKHCWKHPHAGWVERVKKKGRVPVGKCSAKLNDAVAGTLLNAGIRVDDSLCEVQASAEFPYAVYAVFEGVPYVAAVTEERVHSMHGYPCLFEYELPLWVRDRLGAIAAEQGYAVEYRKWLKNLR